MTKSFLVCKFKKFCFLYKNFSLALAFCKIEFTMFSPVRVCSKIAPRYLTLSLGSITLPLHSIFKFDCDLASVWNQTKSTRFYPSVTITCYQSAVTNDLKLSLKQGLNCRYIFVCYQYCRVFCIQEKLVFNRTRHVIHVD